MTSVQNKHRLLLVLEQMSYLLDESLVIAFLPSYILCLFDDNTSRLSKADASYNHILFSLARDLVFYLSNFAINLFITFIVSFLACPCIYINIMASLICDSLFIQRKPQHAQVVLFLFFNTFCHPIKQVFKKNDVLTR